MKLIMQHDENDCGAACLAMVCASYGIKYPIVKYRELLNFNSNGTSIYDISHAGEKIGFKTMALKGSYRELLKSIKDREIMLPCIAVVKKEEFFHYIVIYKVTSHKIYIADPDPDPNPGPDPDHKPEDLSKGQNYKNLIFDEFKAYHRYNFTFSCNNWYKYLGKCKN